MENFSGWVSMGGYGWFIWPAFATALLILLLLYCTSLRRLHRREREWRKLQPASAPSQPPTT